MFKLWEHLSPVFSFYQNFEKFEKYEILLITEDLSHQWQPSQLKQNEENFFPSRNKYFSTNLIHPELIQSSVHKMPRIKTKRARK